MCSCASCTQKIYFIYVLSKYKVGVGVEVEGTNETYHLKKKKSASLMIVMIKTYISKKNSAQ